MSLSRDVVLLLTHSGDFFTIDRVTEALSKKGVKPFRFDTDKFPLEVQISIQLAPTTSSYTLQYRGESINTEAVRSVWRRRIWKPDLGKNMAPQFQEASIRESKATLKGFWDSLRNVRWIDNLERIRIAQDKQRQLRIASEVGFIIPRTLITNNPAAVRAFFQQVQGKMVTKLLTALSYSMEYASFSLYTSVVKEEDLLEAESLRYCPMVFQEEIPKHLELRAVFVQGKIFTGALDASTYAASKVDWRKPEVDSGAWQHHDLPSPVIEQIRAFMAKFGLHFGAFDFILTPAGEYVFLEVNPAGEWGMLERDLNLPISQAIAEALIA